MYRKRYSTCLTIPMLHLTVKSSPRIAWGAWKDPCWALGQKANDQASENLCTKLTNVSSFIVSGIFRPGVKRTAVEGYRHQGELNYPNSCKTSPTVHLTMESLGSETVGIFNKLYIDHEYLLNRVDFRFFISFFIFFMRSETNTEPKLRKKDFIVVVTSTHWTEPSLKKPSITDWR